MQNMPIGQYMKSKGYITEETLQTAVSLLDSEKYEGYKLGELLVAEGFIEIEMLGEYMGIPTINVLKLLQYIDTNIFDKMDKDYLLQKRFLPFRKDKEGFLVVAMVNVQSKSERNEITQYLMAKQIISNHRQVKFYLSTLFMISQAIDYTARREEIAESKMSDAEREAKYVETLPEEERPRYYYFQVIANAIKNNVSDIHLDPYDEELYVRYRIDGVLTSNPVYKLPKRLYHQPIFAIIKTAAELNVAEKRKPQGGSITFETEDKQYSSDLRVSFLNTVRGEKCVIRLLPKSSNIKKISDLGFTDEQKEKINYLANRPKGMVLVTGPTGSGKTTSLYAILQSINDGTRNIMTAEDPVEMYIEGIHQVKVNKDIDFTFDAILREFLRQDPEVLLVGEIRDYETAKIASQAAETGHLVFSTLHTNNALETINRLVNMGIPIYLLNASLNAVIAQRLVRRLCPICRVKKPLTKSQKLYIEEKVKQSPNKVTQDYLTHQYFAHNPEGCPNCNEGYKGRLAVYEILLFNDTLKNIVSRSTNIDIIELTREAIADGHELMYVDALKKARQGATSIEEIMKIVE